MNCLITGSGSHDELTSRNSDIKSFIPPKDIPVLIPEQSIQVKKSQIQRLLSRSFYAPYLEKHSSW
jgi:hypothetical protein